ncbi:MAG: hypothetical protein DSZ07_07500, partial [Sulfurovum sp.]
MNAKEFDKFLHDNYASKYIYEHTKNKGLVEFVTTTDQADWLIWLFINLYDPKLYSREHKTLLRASVVCAEYARRASGDRMDCITSNILDVFKEYSEGLLDNDCFDFAEKTIKA